MTALALQVAGIILLVVGATVGLGVWAGFVVAGIATLAFGLAVERIN